MLLAPAAWAQVNIAYGPAALQVLDLYQPAGVGPFPLVVFIHGGGWVGGNKAVGKYIAPSLAAAGYAVASVEYRKVPEVTAAAQVGDAAQAVAFLLRNAARFRLDPAGVALIGHSSGAHVAALLATDQSYLSRAGVDPRRLRAMIALDGVYDVTANLTQYPSSIRMEVFGSDKAAWRALSPSENLRHMQAHPGFCLLHEDTDPRFIEQAGLFAQALTAHHEALRSAVAPGLRHPQLVGRFATPGTVMLPFTLDCLGHFLSRA